MQKYIDSLEKNCVKYKVLLWNRTGERKQYPLHYIVYNRELDLYVPKWKKIPAFVGFSKFLYKELLNQRFDRLIMLTTLPTVISAPLLLAKYKKKYIYDFRDMSFEKCIPFRILVDKLVKHSYFTSVSSPGYMTVIKGDTIISHNFRYSDLDNGLNKMKPFKEKITLLHIGITRGEEYNKRLADIFGNDNRFEVKIIGTGNDTKPFVEYIKKFRNITVKGTYNNEENDQTVSIVAYFQQNFCNEPPRCKQRGILVYFLFSKKWKIKLRLYRWKLFYDSSKLFKKSYAIHLTASIKPMPACSSPPCHSRHK